MNRVNDFAFKIATANGTGSASANGLIMQSIFRMGVPVTGKNVFPSNIQGLPTWYEIRVNKSGYSARTPDFDLMVALNAATYKKDVAEVRSGGWLLYDATWPLDAALKRPDVTYLGVPLAQMCNDAFKGVRERILMKNIAYAGALAALLEIDTEVLKQLLKEKFGRKPALMDSNQKAVSLGYDYAKANLPAPLPIRLETMDATKDSILIDGNTAAGLGCVYAGATVGAWYPITPATSLMEAFRGFCQKYRVDAATKKNRFAIVQAEDELAAAGVVIGAGWAGARAFTPTSGPGISLMNEFIGLAYFTEIPSVFFDVQRTGPSTGMPTRTQQSDILLAAYASHGDTKHPLLFPASPKECFEMTADAFELTEHLQTPVILMTDLDLGMNDHVTEPLVWDDSQAYNRGKVLTSDQLEAIANGTMNGNGGGRRSSSLGLPGRDGSDETAGEPLQQFRGKFGRYLDIDDDGIPYRTIPGTNTTYGAFVTRGSSRDEYAVYTEDGDAYRRNVDRLARKWDTAKELVPGPEFLQNGNTRPDGVIFFGTSTYAAEEAIELLREEGIELDAMRVRAFPFGKAFRDFADAHDRLFVIEQNRDAQFRSLMMIELGIDASKLISVLNYDGMPITADNIFRQIRDKV